MRQFVLPVGVSGLNEVVLTGEDYHYLVHVLRLSAGDTFSGVGPDRNAVLCTIQSISGTACTITFVPAQQTPEHEKPMEPRITLFQCLPKGRKLEQIIRQVTECGVAEIVPVRSRYSIAEVPEDKVASKMERWRRIAREAVQQSGAAGLPEIRQPVPITQIGKIWKNRGPGLAFHQNCLDSSRFLGTLSRSSPQPPGEIAVCIGPEGGFADEEVEMLGKGGFTPVYLGERVLRTETAAVYAVAAVQTYIETVFPERRAWKNSRTSKE